MSRRAASRALAPAALSSGGKPHEAHEAHEAHLATPARREAALEGAQASVANGVATGVERAVQRLEATAGNRATVRALAAPGDGRALQLHPAHPHRPPPQDQERYEVLGVRVPPPVGGRALPVQLRSRLEGSLNVGLSDVRVHEDASAVDLDALAYTRGADIYTAPGHYQPHSGTGQRLLAHELVHVIQQRADRVPSPRRTEGQPVNEDRNLESEADRLGRRALWGLPSAVRGARSTVRHVTSGVVQPARSPDSAL